MNNPDFSQSAEHVALAKELAAANYLTWHGERPEDVDAHWDGSRKREKESYLAMADVAITHLGSGYRLPEATEANAERLADSHWAMRRNPSPLDAWDEKEWRRYALQYLRALHAAFTEPAEKPEKPCNCADCSPASWPETNGWRCGKEKRPIGPQICSNAFHLPEKPEPVFPGMPAPERSEAEIRLSDLGFKYASLVMDDARSPSDAVQILCAAAGKLPKGEPTVAQNATVAPDPDSPADPTVCRPGCDRKFGHLGECGNDAADFAAEVAEVERKRLLEAFMRDMVSNPAVMAKMLENYEADEDAIAARLHEIALAFTQELIG